MKLERLTTTILLVVRRWPRHHVTLLELAFEETLLDQPVENAIMLARTLAQALGYEYYNARYGKRPDTVVVPDGEPETETAHFCVSGRPWGVVRKVPTLGNEIHIFEGEERVTVTLEEVLDFFAPDRVEITQSNGLVEAIKAYKGNAVVLRATGRSNLCDLFLLLGEDVEEAKAHIRDLWPKTEIVVVEAAENTEASNG